jgi:hypothetical protein
MIIQSYIRVLSDEVTIKAIHKETNIATASIKRLKARRDTVGEDRWWNWGTEYTNIDIDNPDDGIKAMLYKHKPIFPIIRKYMGPDTDVYLEIVVRYAQGDEPLGLCLSAETILLISELGGAVDIDAVSLIEKS